MCNCLPVQDEAQHRPYVTQIINRMANYEGGIVPNIEQEGLEDDDLPKEKKKSKKKKTAGKVCIVEPGNKGHPKDCPKLS